MYKLYLKKKKTNVEREKERNTIPYNDILLCDAKESGHFIRNCFSWKADQYHSYFPVTTNVLCIAARQTDSNSHTTVGM